VESGKKEGESNFFVKNLARFKENEEICKRYAQLRA
jgi:hypothetical protein